MNHTLQPSHDKRGRRTRPLLLFSGCASLAALAALAAPLSAQAESGITRTVEAEVSANYFFGATQQLLTALRTGFERRSDRLAVRAEGALNYGEVTEEDRGKFVSRRSWIVSSNVDWYPRERLSPFIMASAESSLERRIDRRYSGGVGNRFNIIRREESLVDFSLALLAEQSRLRVGEAFEEDMLARWSARFRGRHRFNERVSVESETFYRPVLDEFSNFTVSTRNSLSYQFARFARMRLSFVDNYDSEAMARGARANNTGEILFGVHTSF